MSDRIEWDEPIDAVRRVGLEVRSIGGEARNATREDLMRACEAVGLHVVDRGVFDAIVAKGEENRLRAEKETLNLALRDCASCRDHANEQNATLRAQLAAAEALTEATRASWQEAIRVKDRLAAIAPTEGGLVERLVAKGWDFRAEENSDETWLVVADGLHSFETATVPAADVPATLARLAGLDGGR